MITPPPQSGPDGYPADLVEVAYLDDGTAVCCRPILPTDGDELVRLLGRLSAETVLRRFLAPVPRAPRWAVRRLVEVDYHDRLALVAVVTARPAEEADVGIVAVARYDRLDDPAEAEAAVVVADRWQRRGIGSRLVWRLAAAAADRGVERFVGVVLAGNRPMLGLLDELGAAVDVRPRDGVVSVVVQLRPCAHPASPRRASGACGASGAGAPTP